MIKRSIAEEKADLLVLAQIIVQRQSGVLTDAEALIAPKALEVWAPDRPYGKGQVIQHEDVLYRLESEVTKSLAHQTPSSPGMLAVYRPIVPGHTGTKADPIPYINGTDCRIGLYYTYLGKLYLCKCDMLPCTWPPGTAGLWQWEEQK